MLGLLPSAARQIRSIQGFARIAETEEGMTKISGYYAGGFYINNVQASGHADYTTGIHSWKTVFLLCHGNAGR